jgi:hypothetical protein
MKIQRAYVNVGGEYVPTDTVGFIDIYEDEKGYQVMTFMYNGVCHKSNVVIK